MFKVGCFPGRRGGMEVRGKGTHKKNSIEKDCTEEKRRMEEMNAISKV